MSASAIAFHVFCVTTVAPTTGARPMSSMYGVCRYHWNSIAASGGVGKPSIIPVVSPVMISVIAMARGSNPFALNHCTMRSFPADVYILIFFRSSTVCTGRFVNTCVQPPWPQFSRTNPLASTRFSMTAVSLSVTAFNSS